MADTQTLASRVLSASDPWSLFGDNPRRAQIRYRRYAKELHPDAGGSVEAMARLNALWHEYGTGRDVSGKARPAELFRNGMYACLDEGDHWLVVERSPGGIARTCAIDALMDLVEGTPVTALRVTGTTCISQPNGAHAAWRTEPYAGTLIPTEALPDHLPGGVLHPADAAWIVKRLVFLGAALASVGLAMSDARCSLAIDPEQHMLVVMAPWSLVPSDGGVADQRKPLGAVSASPAMLSGDARLRRILRFVQGAEYDRVTESSSLLREYDELLYELFGPPSFHVMETI